jgi:hypothetical protein
MLSGTNTGARTSHSPQLSVVVGAWCWAHGVSVRHFALVAFRLAAFQRLDRVVRWRPADDGAHMYRQI